MQQFGEYLLKDQKLMEAVEEEQKKPKKHKKKKKATAAEEEEETQWISLYSSLNTPI